MVVLIILSLTMGMSVLSIRSGLGGNDLQGNLRHLHALCTELRHQALLKHQTQRLHIRLNTLDGAVYWTGDTQPDTAVQPLLSGATRLEGVSQTPDKRHTSGRVSIAFSPTGLAQPTRFFLRDKDTAYIVRLRAFTPELDVEKRHAPF